MARKDAGSADEGEDPDNGDKTRGGKVYGRHEERSHGLPSAQGHAVYGHERSAVLGRGVEGREDVGEVHALGYTEEDGGDQEQPHKLRDERDV